MKSYVELVNFAAPGGRCDITPVFASALGFQRLIDDLLAPFESASIQTVAGIDALGFILGTAAALKLGVGFVPVRKAGKLPDRCDSRRFVDYTGKEKGLELGLGAIAPGSRVLVVDDWIETGAQMRAAIALVEGQGGVVVGVCAFNIDDSDRTHGLMESYACHSILRNCAAP